MIHNFLAPLFAILFLVAVVSSSEVAGNGNGGLESNSGPVYLYNIEPDFFEPQQVPENLLRALRSTIQESKLGNKQRFFPYYKGLGRK